MTKIAVVTGASSGIGKETAKALAAQGWRIIGIGRDARRSDAAAAEIRAMAGGGEVVFLRADLSLMADVVRVAEEVALHTDRVDVLVNNAGGMAKEQKVTPEGFEESFAGNHLGPFLLTKKLLPLLRRAAQTAPAGSVRILNTSSDAGEMIPGLPWDDLQLLNRFNSGQAYCNVKLANVMFARGLARHYGAEGIVAHAMHPGFVDSNFINNAPEASKAHMLTLEGQTPAQGADTLIWLATSAEGGQSNGGYFYQRKPRAPNKFAEDEANVERLWNESEKLLEAAGF